MLIRNVYQRPLTILFEDCAAEYEIALGESKEIVPFQEKVNKKEGEFSW